MTKNAAVSITCILAVCYS